MRKKYLLMSREKGTEGGWITEVSDSTTRLMSLEEIKKSFIFDIDGENSYTEYMIVEVLWNSRVEDDEEL